MSAVIMMMMNCFRGMVERREALSLISSRDHCRRFPPLQISDKPRTGFSLPRKHYTMLPHFMSENLHFRTNNGRVPILYKTDAMLAKLLLVSILV